MRIFIVDGREFPDPDPSLTVDEVRESWTNWFPELSNATTQERKDGETTYIEFRKTVGTKGRPTGRRTAFRGELPGEYLKRSLVAVSTGALTEGGRIKEAHYVVKTTRLDNQFRVEVEHEGLVTVLPHKVVEQIVRHMEAIKKQQRRDRAVDQAQRLTQRKEASRAGDELPKP